MDRPTDENLHQIVAHFWSTFGDAAGMPLDYDGVAVAYQMFFSRIEDKADLLEGPTLDAALECCRRAGRRAGQHARRAGVERIRPADFERACAEVRAVAFRARDLAKLRNGDENWALPQGILCA